MIRSFLTALLAFATLATAQAAVPAPTAPLARPTQSPQAEPMPLIPAPPPATALEAFGRRIGSVIVRGYTDVAGLRDDAGVVIRVLAVEFTDLRSHDKASGLAIEVHQPGIGVVTSLVDEDEIDALIDGIETLAKVEHSVSGLANFDARFRTRGALELANIDENGTRRVTLTATQILPANGQLVWGTASLPLARAKELQSQLILARDALARLKPVPPEEPGK